MMRDDGKKKRPGRIISVSRRTDIPAYLSDWFFKRLSDGYVEVVNPFNRNQISYIPLSPDNVRGFVFWSKNPRPMLGRLDLLSAYRYYFLFTLNPYGNDIEPGLPPKQTILDTFKRLSGAVGRERVIWRYDPVLLNETIDVDFHTNSFGETAGLLNAYTGKVIFSFIDHYKKTEAAMEALHIKSPLAEQKLKIAENFSRIARDSGLTVECCAENMDLSPYNIARARCVDPALLSRQGGAASAYSKDRGQREFCACAASVDIGAYGTCRAGCVYCYAR
jgi:hypothetical protein